MKLLRFQKQILIVIFICTFSFLGCKHTYNDKGQSAFLLKDTELESKIPFELNENELIFIEKNAKSYKLFDKYSLQFSREYQIKSIIFDYNRILINNSLAIKSNNDNVLTYLYFYSRYSELTNKFFYQHRKFRPFGADYIPLHNNLVLVSGESISGLLNIDKNSFFEEPLTQSYKRNYSNHIVLDNNDVLFVGGERVIDGSNKYEELKNAELFNSKNNSFESLPPLAHPVGRIQLLNLRNGDIFLLEDLHNKQSVEIFDYKKHKFYSLGELAYYHGTQTSLYQIGDSVLVTGGNGSEAVNCNDKAELFNLSKKASKKVLDLHSPRCNHYTFSYTNSKVILVGGNIETEHMSEPKKNNSIEILKVQN